MLPSRTLGTLLLAVGMPMAHGYGCPPMARPLQRAPPQRTPAAVMRRREDTLRAAGSAAERAAEQEQRAAEAVADPEPGPCIQCGDEGTYWDGMVTFACTKCGHEWGIEEAAAEAAAGRTCDVNGAELAAGDQVVLVKDLAGGKLKKGLKVKVRLGDFGDGHDLEATIPSQGTYALKSEFVKKAG